MKKKTLLSIALVFLLCLSFTACGGDGNATGDGNTGQGQEQQPQDSDTETSPIAVSVDNVFTTKEDEWDELTDGTELLVLEVTVTNDGDSDYEFNPNYVSVQFSGETVMESSIAPKDKKTLDGYTMAPGETISGAIPFEVPEGTTDYRIFYDDFENNFEIEP